MKSVKKSYFTNNTHLSVFDRGTTNKCSRLFVVCLIFVMQLLIFSQISFAAADLSRSYNSDTTIIPGSLVSLDNQKENYIVLSDSNDNNQLIGVATTTKNSLLAINPNSSDTQVSVSGVVSTLVSTLGGDIKAGDMISESFIKGVGAKARPGTKVIGVAQEQFPSTTTQNKMTTILDSQGQSKQIKVGYVKLMLSVSEMPPLDNFSGSVKGLEDWTSSIVGHSVSAVRLAVSGAVALFAIVFLMVMIYGSITRGITAVSRNPLAKPAIFESQLQMMSMVALTSIVCIATMYLILVV